MEIIILFLKNLLDSNKAKLKHVKIYKNNPDKLVKK